MLKGRHLTGVKLAPDVPRVHVRRTERKGVDTELR